MCRGLCLLEYAPISQCKCYSGWLAISLIQKERVIPSLEQLILSFLPLLNSKRLWGESFELICFCFWCTSGKQRFSCHGCCLKALFWKGWLPFLCSSPGLFLPPVKISHWQLLWSRATQVPLPLLPALRTLPTSLERENTSRISSQSCTLRLWKAGVGQYTESCVLAMNKGLWGLRMLRIEV